MSEPEDQKALLRNPLTLEVPSHQRAAVTMPVALTIVGTPKSSLVLTGYACAAAQDGPPNPNAMFAASCIFCAHRRLD